MEKFEDRVKGIYAGSWEGMQQGVIRPLMRLFGRNEMQESAENCLFRTVNLGAKMLEEGKMTEIVEDNFVFLKKKMLKLLVFFVFFSASFFRFF